MEQNKLLKTEKSIIINRKWLFNSYDILIKNLFNKGMYFFSLTINFNEDIIKASKKIILNWLEGTSKTVKTPQEYMDYVIRGYNNRIFSQIEMIDFSYAVIEKSKRENFYHTHILLCVRSIDPNVENVERHILNVFNGEERLLYEDFKLDILQKFLDVKRFLRYMSKDLDKLDEHINNSYFHYFSIINRIDYNDIVELMDTFVSENSDIEFDSYIHYSLNCLLREQIGYNGKYNEIDGYDFRKKTQKNIIIYYINLYLKLNNMFFYNDSLYIKNHKSQFSYICLGNYNKLVDLIPDIFTFFSTCFATISHNEIWSYIINNPLFLSNILQSEIKIFCHETINFNVLEFNDGLFSLKHNLFIPFENLSEENSKHLKLLRYYNVNYKNNVKKNKPNTWLKYLSKNVKDIKLFCTQFGQYFYHEDDIDKNREQKQNSMFIQGVSSSGKTLLLTKQLLSAWGPQNITMLIDNSSFTFENVGYNKMLMINDEFTYKSKDRSLLLKLLDKVPMAINRKFKRADISKYNISTIFLANYSKENIALLTDIAFKNRLNVYNFDNEFQIDEKEMLKIKNEEAQIIIYCNRLFLENKNKGKENRLTLKQKEKLFNDILLLR